MSLSRLHDAITSYEETIAAIRSENNIDASTSPSVETESKVRNALIARDHVASVLQCNNVLDSESLSRVTELDRILNDQTKKILAMTRPFAFESWRKVIQVSDASWWWFLDKQLYEPAPIPVWTVLATLFFVASIVLILDTTSLMLGSKLDTVKVFSTLLSASIAFIGAGALTEVGRRWIERISFRTGFTSASINAWRTVIALVMLILAFLTWIALPPLAARFYNNRAYGFQRSGLTSKAIDSYQRALALNPAYVEAHYNLGLSYEDAGEYENAIGEYRRSILIDRSYYRAYNNLARLYILQRKDYAEALNYLKLESDLSPQEPSVRYSLYKNRGWANWGLQAYPLAEQDLREAIKLVADPRANHYGGAAHCLLAQVLKAQGTKEQPSITHACEQCVAYGSDPDSEDLVEASWLTFAQECLRLGDHK